MRAWEYDPPIDELEEEAVSYDGPFLSSDIGCGVPFARCVLASSPDSAVRALSQMMRWIFIGEGGTGTETHVDPIASHAWMWVAVGEKDWRILVQSPSTTRHLATKRLPDLFSCASVAELSEADAELWHGSLRAGELLFLPAGAIHSVWNASPGLTIALTHNFVDAACLCDTLNLLSAAIDLCAVAVTSGTPLDAALQALQDDLGALLCGLLVAALHDPSSIEALVLSGSEILRGVHDCPESVARSCATVWMQCKQKLSQVSAALCDDFPSDA